MGQDAQDRPGDRIVEGHDRPGHGDRTCTTGQGRRQDRRDRTRQGVKEWTGAGDRDRGDRGQNSGEDWITNRTDRGTGHGGGQGGHSHRPPLNDCC